MSEDRVRAHVFISGNVQGVAYRANTEEAAKERGLDGWVRNLDDGRVEAVFEGDPEVVDDMLDWCETGSPAADVNDVSVEYEDHRSTDGFHVRWSG